MSDPTRHDPCAGTHYIEEHRFRFPPKFLFRSQGAKAFCAVLGVTPDKVQAGLWVWKRRGVYVDPQHVREPSVFAHTLMNHLLVNAAAAPVRGRRPDRHIFIRKLAPNT